MKIERKWAMSNKWTFMIKPIKELLEEEMGTGLFIKGLWLDPFAGKYSSAQITNDLNPKMPTRYHLDALVFLKQQKDNSVDGILFDPPYSPRQIQECYQNIGTPLTGRETKASFWSDIKNEIARIVKVGGKAICFGWNSVGIGKKRSFELKRILLVSHGGVKNDTICTVEIKIKI